MDFKGSMSTGSGKTLGTILRDPIVTCSAGQAGCRQYAACQLPTKYKYPMFCKHVIFHGRFAQRLGDNKLIVITYVADW